MGIERRRDWSIAAPLAWMVCAVALLLFSHLCFFYYRDNFSTHYPIKAYSARVFRQFQIPYWNFAAGGGQPLAGNPNTVSFYPDNLLYLVLPTHVAFNLHFLIHLLAGAYGVRALARRYGAGDTTAATAALIYALSGPVISSLAFYNLIIAVALIPLCLLSMEIFLQRPGWAASLILGAVFGLLALGGEPVIFFGAILSTAILLAFRFATTDAIRGQILLRGGLAVLVAILIALPLLISYSEIANEVERSTWRFSTQTVLAASLTPAQLLEAILGPLRGLITDLSERGFRANPSARGWPPLFLSTLMSALLLPAFFTPSKSARPYRWILLTCGFLALGRFNPLVEWLVNSFPSGRMVRYPEKLALPMTVAAAILMAIWLGEAVESRRARIAAAVGVLLIITMVAMGLMWAGFNAASKQRLIANGLVAIVALTFVVLAMRFPAARTAAVVVMVAQLLYWAARTAPVDWSAPYRETPQLAREGVSNFERVARPLEPDPLDLAERTDRHRYRIKAQMLDPLFGLAFHVAYGTDRSPDGMYYALSRVVSERVDAARLPVGLRYLRLAGCSVLMTRNRLEDPSLRLLTTALVGRNAVHRYAVAGAAPYVRAAATIKPVRSVEEAVRLIEAWGFDEAGTVIASAAVRSRPAGPAAIHRLIRHRQRIEFDIDAPQGATLVVNETYFSAWSARGTAKGKPTGTALSIFPANLDRLGVVVPPGQWHVSLEFGRRRQLVAATWVLSSLFLLIAAGAAIRLSKNRTASPDLTPLQ